MAPFLAAVPSGPAFRPLIALLAFTSQGSANSASSSTVSGLVASTGLDRLRTLLPRLSLESLVPAPKAVALTVGVLSLLVLRFSQRWPWPRRHDAVANSDTDGQ